MAGAFILVFKFLFRLDLFVDLIEMDDTLFIVISKR